MLTKRTFLDDNILYEHCPQFENCSDITIKVSMFQSAGSIIRDHTGTDIRSSLIK